jgi:biopolymer transport protein ExbD
MSRQSLLLLLGAAFLVLLAGLSAGAYWYLFGANEIESAELVPANTIFFASIPNAAALLEGYQSSQAKTLIGSPNIKPLQDYLTGFVGQKNIDLLQTFLPNLSGQSFVAVTHFDYDHPEKSGLIAAMKPKAGLGDFGNFLDKLKATWPAVLAQGKTGTGNVEGVDYQWIQGPGAPDKICVAQIGGWIVTAWGEASLQDWIQRYEKKSDTSSLAKDLNYVKAVTSVGDNPTTLLYVNVHDTLDLLGKQIEKTNPAAAAYLEKRLENFGGAAIGTRFENGEIVDRFSFLFPRPAQLESGMGVDPCPFDTLKFTGPDTRFYWASTVDWKQYAKHLRAQAHPEQQNPIAGNSVAFLQNWTRTAGLDGDHDIVDALGSEVSLQLEWPEGDTYPSVGFFAKLDHPDVFAPTIKAIISSVRQAYATTAVVQELTEGDQHFAALQFVQASIMSPTITEDGPYLGVFLTENQAVRSFQRVESLGLAHNASFTRQLGDKRNGATQVIFLDSPYLLDRTYRTVLPFLSIAQMFNKTLAGLVAGKELPPDLGWLAPIGTWSCVITPDEDGIQGYSISGIGNQGIFLSSAMGGTANFLQSMGLIPQPVSALGSLLVMPPAAAPAPAMGLAPAPISPPPTATSSTIYITNDSKLLVDQTPVPVEQIGDYLKGLKAANPALKLSVTVAPDASPDTLSTVMDAGASAGFGVLPYSYTARATAATTNAASPVAPAPAAGASTNIAPAPVTNSDVIPTNATPLQPQ